MSVGSIFFTGYSDPKFRDLPKSMNYDLIDDIACSLICSAISRIPAYEFNKTIDQSRADGLWRGKLDSEDAYRLGVSLYWWAFPDHCCSDKHTLRDYVNDDKKGWGQKYSDFLTRKEFLNELVLKIQAGEPNWPQKILVMFRKLWFLDAGQYDALGSALIDAYPDIFKILTHARFDNFISSDRFSDTIFIDQAAKAINDLKETRDTTSAYIPGVGPFITVVIYQIWGERVESFLADKPKKIGIATGKGPKNRKTTTF